MEMLVLKMCVDHRTPVRMREVYPLGRFPCFFLSKKKVSVSGICLLKNILEFRRYAHDADAL